MPSNPTPEGQITFNLCTKLYLRRFSKERKNWQHCSQEFHWRTWIDSNTHQIAVLVPHCGQWNMGGVTCVTSEWRQEKPRCDSLVCLFFLPQRLHVPDGACARASLTTNICRLWWVCVCLYMSVCVCVHFCLCVCICVYVWDLGVTLSSSRAESLLMDTKEKEDLKRRQNLSHEAGTFLDLPFLLCLHPKLLPQVSPCFLCWAWLFLSHHFWLTNT